MRTLHAQFVTPQAISAKKIVRFERSGRYEEALEMFGENWSDPVFLPEVEGLTDEDSAEVLLRFGSLIGFIGNKLQTAGAQERSKDILTNAYERFSDLQNVSKIAECENYIALAYWRKGEHQEALTWIDWALSHDLPTSNDACLYAHVTKSLIYLSLKRYDENIVNCLSLEKDFRTHADAFLNGSLCSNIGLSFKNISRTFDATHYLGLARTFHEKSRHKIYLGTVENNLAQLFKAARRFDSAHEAADAATRIFKKVKDKNREAFSIDTKAQVYLAEGKYPEALAAADKSIKLLKQSEASAYLAESLMTKSKILLLADNFSDAVLNLIEAVNITRTQNSEAAAKGLIDEFCETLKEKNMPTAADRHVETDKMELLLPPAIAHYSNYKGVWISSEHFESIGVPPGSLAIVVDEKIKRGDLIAVAELESDLITCGFYDAEFGIVCLERGDDDPQLFNEDDIRVLGKIVGVCSSGKDANGKMTVEALIR